MPKRPSLPYDETLAMLEKGQIQGDRLGSSPIWQITETHRRLQISKGTFLNPNIRQERFARLPNLPKLMRQQIHILEGYSREEGPKLDISFEKLQAIYERLGLTGRYSQGERQELLDELTAIIGNLATKDNEPKLLVREQILKAMTELRDRISRRKIRQTIGEAIEFLFKRFDEIELLILPGISRKRTVATYAIASNERRLWRIAYTLQTRMKTTAVRNVAVALSRDLETMHIPKAQPFREQVMKVRTEIRNAIAAIKAGNLSYASHLLFCAIIHLGFEPESLRLIPRKEAVRTDEKEEEK